MGNPTVVRKHLKTHIHKPIQKQRPPTMTTRILPKNAWLKQFFYDYDQGERCSQESALRLLLLEDDNDQRSLWAFADKIRKKHVGDVVYYSSTLYLYPTNFCDFNCTFCAFYAKPGDSKGWLYSPDQLIEKIYQAPTITEVHIVSGCFPKCNLDYYVELFTKIKKDFPHIHIKALTGIEHAYLADLHNISVKDVLLTLKNSGLDSIPGGGFEVLVDEIRKQLAPQRLSSEEFLEIHRTAHQLGIPSNSTLLCYHKERPEDIVTHMQKLRDLQDETRGFKNFVMLKFAAENNSLGKRLTKWGRSHRIPPASIIAVSRLFLDNFKNIKALWNYLGIDLALHLLSCGANDFSSTHLGEKVFTMASSQKK
ncbi:FO synthase subunit 2 [Chlamydia avium 10DC88]|uniref:FO synthase subunit 2 n=1 Tax=Chlamydia avium 10DC88 TaxID=1229831 RepID=W8JKW5_9CHLA|nr:FO synthase subunit 2 [Chlamydia avium 10DC88]